MSKRRNYGRALMFAAILLGAGMLFGSYKWMDDQANMILGVFVFIIYAIGQWMTILYWQNIQADWESTGEVLGRLQQAVSDIPAALDSNLKSIATRLSEGQAQALSKLQSEVSSGARETLEKGSAMIGDSLAKNLAAPLESMKTLLSTFADKSTEQTAQLQALTQSVREDSRAAVGEGAALITASLDKHLKAPLTSLETVLTTWQKQAAAQIEASRAFGEELRKAQREWSEKAQGLAAGLSAEFTSLAASTVRSGETSQAAWAERAAEVQSAWEAKIQDLQSRLLEDVVAKVAALQSAQTSTQEQILARALTGMEGQAKIAQESATAQAKTLQGAADAQAKAMRDASAAFEAGLESLRESSLRLIADVEAKAVAANAGLVEHITAGQTRLVEEISGLQRQTLGDAAKSLDAQGQLGLEVAGKVSDLADALRQGSRDLAELAHVSQINQTEMQAGVAMLNTGLSSILDRLEKQADAGDGYQALLAELGRTLASFQERAGEVLVENAMKTQEILMEVLHQQEGSSGRDNGRGVEGQSEALASVS
jgi:hypothetical protein